MYACGKKIKLCTLKTETSRPHLGITQTDPTVCEWMKYNT